MLACGLKECLNYFSLDYDACLVVANLNVLVYTNNVDWIFYR